MKFALWLNTDPESIDLLIAGGYDWPAAKGAFEGTALDKPYEFFGGQKINDVFAEADHHGQRQGGMCGWGLCSAWRSRLLITCW